MIVIKHPNALQVAPEVMTHLIFEGAAEEAMNFYISLFRGSEIISTCPEHRGGKRNAGDKVPGASEISLWDRK